MKLFKNQNGYSDVITVAFIAGIIGAIFITGTFIWQEVDKVKLINSFYDRLFNVSVVNQENSEKTKNKAEVEELVLKELPEEFRFQDKTAEIDLDKDYIIVNSILSNDKKKLAYAEMYKYTKHPSCEDKCPLKYRIKVKDLDTGGVKILYENNIKKENDL